MKLRISDDLVLGADFVTSTSAVLGKKRSGKTYWAQKIAEGLLAAKQQVVVIDLTSAWWGLRSSADGKSPGYPITIFGGRHGDVPLEATAGAMLAEAIVADRFSAVLDVRLLKKSQRIRFIADFLEALYDKNTEAMHLFMDESDAYIPQRSFSPEEARALGAADELVRRGGIGGIGVTMISQRAQVLNKNVLSQVDTLSVLRMNHPKDIDAVEDWMSNHAGQPLIKEILTSLSALPRGDAWYLDPEHKIFQRVTVAAKSTYDSGRTPKVGERVVPPKVLAKVDLEHLGVRIAATVEQAKANDPKHLRAELERYKKANAELVAGTERSIQAQLSKAPPKVVERRVLKDGQIQRVELMISAGEKLIDRWNNVSADAHEALDALRGKATAAFTSLGIELAGIRAAIASTKTPSPVDRFVSFEPAKTAKNITVVVKPPIGRVVTIGETALPKVERLMLTALAQHPDGLTRKQVLIFSGYRHSGTTTKAFARLLAEEYAEANRGLMTITSRGSAILGPYEPLPVGDELRARLLNGSDLAEVERTILQTASEVYPSVISREAARGRYAHSGTTTKAFARLIAMAYLTKARGGVRAAEELFG